MGDIGASGEVVSGGPPPPHTHTHQNTHTHTDLEEATGAHGTAFAMGQKGEVKVKKIKIPHDRITADMFLTSRTSVSSVSSRWRTSATVGGWQSPVGPPFGTDLQHLPRKWSWSEYRVRPFAPLTMAWNAMLLFRTIVKNGFRVVT